MYARGSCADIFIKFFFLSRSFCVSLSSIQDKDDFSF